MFFCFKFFGRMMQILTSNATMVYLSLFFLLHKTFVCIFAVYHELKLIVHTLEFNEIFCSTPFLPLFPVFIITLVKLKRKGLVASVDVKDY